MSEKPRKMSVIRPARPLFRHHRTLQKYYEISDGNRGEISELTVFLLLIYNTNEAKQTPPKKGNFIQSEF